MELADASVFEVHMERVVLSTIVRYRTFFLNSGQGQYVCDASGVVPYPSISLQENNEVGCRDAAGGKNTKGSFYFVDMF